MTVHAHRAGAMLRKRRRGKRPRHPWLAAVDGLAILGIAFKTRAEAILYAERVIALEHETAGAESCPPPPAELGAVRTTPLFYSPLSGNGNELRGRNRPSRPA